MKILSRFMALFGIAALVLASGMNASFNPLAGLPAARAAGGVPAPEFTHTDADAWLNSPPLKLADLRDKVVLLDVWTYGCWNCYRSIPWLHTLEKNFGAQGFQIIGVHSPEFEHEKVKTNVVAKLQEHAITHPTMMDNDFSYWRALGNRYWPAFYLLDKQGRVRGVYTGETHIGDSQARAVETAIAALLAETTASTR